LRYRGTGKNNLDSTTLRGGFANILIPFPRFITVSSRKIGRKIAAMIRGKKQFVWGTGSTIFSVF
jgi:hypothetical protein